jgi:type I restriction enzyme S subunit
MKKYDSYKDSGVEWIGDIPSHWKTIKTYIITKNYDGKRVPLNSEQRSEMGGEIPYWGSGGIVDYINDYIFDEELLLVGEDGSPFFDNYRDVSFYVNEKIWVNNHIHILKTKEFVNTRFLVKSFNCVEYREYITGSTRDKLTQTDLNRIIHPIPPLSEQSQIVQFLDTKTSQIDSLIEKTQRKIQLLKENRTSLINEVVTKGLNPNVEMKDSGVEWIGEIPSHWFCVGTNKVYHDLGTGTTPTSDNTEYYDESGHHWITTTDLNEGIMYDTLTKITDKSLEDYPNLRLYPSGSIFISMYGGRIGKLGVSTFESYCNQSVCVLPKNDKINVKFYYYWFLGFQELVKNMGRGGGQPNINKDMIKQFPTVKLSLSEQTEIVSYLDEHTQLIDKTISVEQRRIDTLKEYRQSLISEVVTGKRKVVD